MSDLPGPGAVAALRAMALVVIADCEGVGSERPVVVDAFHHVTGKRLTDAAVDLMVENARTNPEASWAWLKENAAVLSEDEKAVAICSAIRVCMADAELQESELATLSKLARSLGVKGRELRRLMSSVWREQRESA